MVNRFMASAPGAPGAGAVAPWTHSSAFAGFFGTVEGGPLHAATRSHPPKIVAAHQGISLAASLCGSASTTATPRAADSA
jgi:hypothetical protein